MEDLLRAVEILLDLDDLIKTSRVLDLHNRRGQGWPPSKRLVPRFAFPASQLRVRSKNVQQLRELCESHTRRVPGENERKTLRRLVKWKGEIKKETSGVISSLGAPHQIGHDLLLIGGECAGEPISADIRMNLQRRIE